MPIVDKLANIDRRLIYLVIGLAVLIPFLTPMRLPIYVSPPVQSVYDYIEALPEGSVVLMGFNFSPSTMPELLPMSLAVLRHCLDTARKDSIIHVLIPPSYVNFLPQLWDSQSPSAETGAEDNIDSTSCQIHAASQP